ncbi:MAG: DNA polymerase IV, partial [Gemmiger sp.]|nr:DNA polymerase IV [Gemmiger sp.]
MPGRAILHIDANAFYASVEMQENPALRGKRIAVCGSKEDRHGIVLTASYPAKRMGVKTGMAIWQAQQCCRDLLMEDQDMFRMNGIFRDVYLLRRP